MTRKTGLLLALALPILVLLSNVIYHQYIQTLGTEVVLPIQAYDPRSLLSGHFLRYQLVYSNAEKCRSSATSTTAYLCLQEEQGKWHASLVPNEEELNCDLYIKGICTRSGFSNGFEKFYIPEQYAERLEKDLRNKQAAIKMRILNDGQVTIKDLLINNVPWKEYIKENPDTPSK